MGGWIDNNLGVVLTIVGWIVITIVWAMNQKGRLDAALDRIKGCEDGAQAHSRSLDTKLETMDSRLRKMGSQLDRLLGAAGRRADDHLEME
jgi:hypothetical protein